MRNPGTMVVVVIALAAALASREPASAAPNGPAEKSLDKCQRTVRSEGVKYAQGVQKALGTCLAKVSGEVLKKNAGVAGAVATCTTQLDKIARSDGKSLGDLFTAKVSAKCNPAPANPHTLEDLVGDGSPGVAEPLDLQRMGLLCARYGGSSSIESASEWISCVRHAHECAAHEAIAAQFPRASFWLEDLADAMPASPARDAVVAAEAAIDGTWDDGIPEGGCSVEVSAPGCPDLLLGRRPDEVLDDLRSALAAEDWDAVACNYHPLAFVIDDQGVLIGPQEIVSSLMILSDFADGAPRVVHEENFFRDLVRELYTLDAGWWQIADGVSTYVVRRGRIVQQTTHGLIEFTGPPPDDT